MSKYGVRSCFEWMKRGERDRASAGGGEPEPCSRAVDVLAFGGMWQTMCRQFLICFFGKPINCTPSCFLLVCNSVVVYGWRDTLCEHFCPTCYRSVVVRIRKMENIVAAHRVEFGVVTVVGDAVDMGACVHETLNRRAHSRGFYKSVDLALDISLSVGDNTRACGTACRN